MFPIERTTYPLREYPYFLQFRSVGGAVSDVGEDDTAYSHRDAQLSVVALGADPVRLDAAWAALRAHGRGMYLSFDSSTDPRRLLDAFPLRKIERLRAVKREVDPEALFADNFSVSLCDGQERAAS